MQKHCPSLPVLLTLCFPYDPAISLTYVPRREKMGQKHILKYDNFLCLLKSINIHTQISLVIILSHVLPEFMKVCATWEVSPEILIQLENINATWKAWCSETQGTASASLFLFGCWFTYEKQQAKDPRVSGRTGKHISSRRPQIHTGWSLESTFRGDET